MRAERYCKPWSGVVAGSLQNEPEASIKTQAGAGSIDFYAFRRKRQQANSRDAPLTSTATTTISTTVGGAFISPSKSIGNLLSCLPSPAFPCATQIHSAVRRNTPLRAG